MIVYVNDKNEIKDVNVTTDSSLTPLFINDANNPFKNWSVARIICYKVTVVNGEVTMMTPYVDSRIMEQLAKSGDKIDSNENDIMDTQIALYENFYELMDVVQNIMETQAAVMELYGNLKNIDVTISNHERRIKNLEEA